MSEAVPYIRRKLDLLIDCCDSPSIMYGHKGGVLEDFILCANCKFEVFGYVLIQMVENWNWLIRARNKDSLVLDRLPVAAFVKSVTDKEELPCMELTSM